MESMEDFNQPCDSKVSPQTPTRTRTPHPPHPHARTRTAHPRLPHPRTAKD